MREHVSVIKTSFGFCLVFLGFRKKCFPTREEYSKFLLGVFFFFSPKREFKKKKNLNLQTESSGGVVIAKRPLPHFLGLKMCIQMAACSSAGRGDSTRRGMVSDSGLSSGDAMLCLAPSSPV